MLTRQQKKELVQEITQNIKDSKSVVLCDYKGLTVEELSQLRRDLRQVGSEMKVARKTLIDLAFEENGLSMDVKKTEGQVGVIYNKEDEVAGAKKTYDFSKSNDNLKILQGALEGKRLTAEEVINLAKLPSKEELLAKVVGSIKSPISGLVNVLGGNLRSLVYVLQAIKDEKQA
ncbi:MAG TPA: 50S ribosomal protein L10 [Candidatus Moranbacteria bacterium]|nr:50S ribosomal protein L10 [Candidatus Moranbacteria bacterium]